MADITLEDLIRRWRGSRTVLQIEIGTGEGNRQAIRREGILDGPYVGADAGTGFRLGRGTISGDIAVGGTLISIDLADDKGPTAPLIGDEYVELRITELPIIAQLTGAEAQARVSLRDGSSVHVRLVVTDEP